uniref:Phosphodiesterase n=1 Tax=Zooxanthella nutricula TaxID=1333877 RepID=A0A7S2QDM2_9DINO
MVLMVFFSLLLSNSVSAIVLGPLENLLGKIRHTASKIFQSVTTMAAAKHNQEEDEEDSDSEEAGDAAHTFRAETALLTKVVRKLSALNEVCDHKKHDVGTERGMDERDRWVLASLEADHREGWNRYGSMDAVGDEERDLLNDTLRAQTSMAESAGLSLDLLNSWNLNPLELDRARNLAAATYFLGPHNHGLRAGASETARFLEEAERGYVKSNPYHNWFHAIDIAHCVYRLLLLCGADTYLTGVERFAILLSAICHDIGHPGVNNMYLIESSHDLALCYNDRAPLENMHAAKLFEILNNSKCDVLGQLTTTQFWEARRVAIDAILHTDAAKHFHIIKEVQMCYEMNSDVFERSADSYYTDEASFPTAQAVDVFRLPESRRFLSNLMLHIADMSNSMKPFRICRIWAWQILEEFFAQGDNERNVGLPVQMMNDRTKMNRAFSQVAVIEFLTAPLAFGAAKVLPPLGPHAAAVLQNARQWQQTWLRDAAPAPSESEREAMGERIRKLQNRYKDQVNM